MVGDGIPKRRHVTNNFVFKTPLRRKNPQNGLLQGSAIDSHAAASVQHRACVIHQHQRRWKEKQTMRSKNINVLAEDMYITRPE